MAINTLSTAQIGFAIVLLSTTTISLPSVAEDITFFCGSSNGIPATVARTSRGEVPLILWNSSTIGESSDTPEKHCEEVSTKFQTYYKNGALKYITTEKKNGQLVACVAPKENEPCSGVLFPLNSNETDPRATLQRIFRIRVASAAPISETGPRIYISLDKFLNGEYPSLAPSTNRTPSPLPGSDRRQ
jgi:hypothetical protein